MAKSTPPVDQVVLSFQLLRNTTSPDEQANGVRSYVVNLPAEEILKLDTRENLRSYIAEHNPKKRNRVHSAIRTTIESDPLRFITRNSGFVISATDIKVDDDHKTITLTEPSILDGAQSQGEIRSWFDEIEEDEEYDVFHVRAEIVVDNDHGQIVETAIARNTATPVKSISQANARGHLEELAASVEKAHPHIRVQRDETDDGYDARRIIQIARLLMPAEVSHNDTPAERLRAYKNPEQCLTDFSAWYEGRTTDADAKARYEFMVQMAPQALSEYEKWEKHPGWAGHRIWEATKKGGRACRRDKTNKIIWISPGLIFPVVGAMSEFVVKQGTKWKLTVPAEFDPSEMISCAVAQFRGHGSDPMLMGRSIGAYDALRTYPRTLNTVIRATRKKAS